MTSTSNPKTNTAHTRPASTTEHILTLADETLRYTATAEWQTLFDKEKPIAELFHIAYLADEVDYSLRPITFIFNGGPGAASAYLHMGALGPKRVYFNADGSLPKPPVKILDNQESWLCFSDLVFVDPIGTGFSRVLPQDQEEDAAKEQEKTEDKFKETQFWEVERDLKSLGEFMQGFLSRKKRWLSPIFIAGESYGGFRVAKLARKLQQDFGIGLSGAILISPALEFSILEGGDYNLSYWATLIPSFAAAAAYHQRARWTSEPGDIDAHIRAAEKFTRQTYIPLLAMGDTAPEDERQAVYQTLADLIGLPVSLIEKHGGRVDRDVFARELLRKDKKIVGLYDAAITAIDPFPNRSTYAGSDPTLDGLQRLFTGGINHHLRDTLKVETDLSYHLLNFDIFKEWKFELKTDFKQGYIGAVDDLRVGMTLNPYMKVLITHGIFDLVTTYFASSHLAALMKLATEVRPNLFLMNYRGGHMFYTWDESRRQWFEQMQAFYQLALG
ncbi:MAG: S10 family peptidase [Cyanophyceae cyanobacterium]